MPTSESTCWTMIRAAAAGSAPSVRNWRGVIWPSFALISPHVGVRRRCARNSTMRLRRCLLNVFATGACSTPRGQVGPRASAISSTESSATWPAASRAGVSAPPRRYRKSRRTMPANLASSTGPGRKRSWPRPVSCKANGRKSTGALAVRHVELLRLRFEENLPIREIARRWATDPANVHKSYALARRSFGRPSWRSSHSTIRAARSTWQRKPRAS